MFQCILVHSYHAMEQHKGNQFTEKKAAILSYDDKALEILYTSNYYKTESFVLANSGTAEEAKDIYQEAFIAVWQNINAGRFVAQKDSSLEAYLFQIAKFKWYDHLKATKKLNVVPVAHDDFMELSFTGEEENYLEKVQHHFKNLGEPCKQVLTLFYFKKQSMSTIAATFSWTEPTAKNNKYRCLQRLRSMVVGKQ